MFQDSKGFVWIGTLNGLNRYDGHSFITLMPELDDKVSLADPRIEHISEDKNGFLWIYTAPQIYSCYDLKKECFVDFTGCGEFQQPYSKKMVASNGDIWLWHEQNGCRRIRFVNHIFYSTTYKVEKSNLPSDKVNDIVEDKSGTIWICTQSGLVKVEDDDTEVMARGIPFSTALASHDQSFFLSTQGDLYKYDQPKGFRLAKKLAGSQTGFNYKGGFQLNNDWIIFTSLGTYTFDLLTLQLKANTVIDVQNGLCTTDNQGDFWVYNGTGSIYYINAATRKTKKLQLVPEVLARSIGYEHYSVVQDIRGIIWISTYGNGIFAYIPETEELTHFSYAVEGPSPISSNFLFNVMEDRLGNIWIGVEHTGISLLSVLNEGASRIFPEDESSVDRSNVIRAITCMKNGEIWISNRNGILYKYNNKLEQTEKSYFFPYSIFTITEDTMENVWIGSRGAGLRINGKWYRNNPDNPNSLSHDHIYDIYNDKKGRIWIATFGGGLNLAIREGDEYTFRHFFPDSHSGSQIRKITEDSNGWMWVASNNGVYVFHPDSLIADASNYHLYNYNNRKIRSNEIHSVFCDSKGYVWIGTAGTGFSICHPTGNYGDLYFEHYSVNDGLVNNMVQSFIEGRNGQMWLATGYGISRFDRQSGLFDNFFFSANLLGNYYSENCVSLLANGNLLFGTNHGLVNINPQKVTPKHVISEVVFTGLKIDGVTIHPNDKGSPLTQAMSYTHAIELKHFQNSFIIEFSTFDFSFMNDSRYTFKLDHFDENWSTPSSLNFAAYKNLPPGKYKLHVKACNAAGVWGNEEAVMDIMIAPPLWKTTWAFFLYFITGCLVLGIIFRVMNKFSMLRSRIQLEEELTEYKLVFFTNIAHEFRAPLTLIQGGLEKLAHTGDMPSDAMPPMNAIRSSAKRLMRLIDQLLMFRKIQNNKLVLTVEETDVIALIEQIFQTFRESARSKNISFCFIPFVDTYTMYVDREFIDKILYNLLSNALKFTLSGGSVVLEVLAEQHTRELIVRVTDTGIGIPEDKRPELFRRFTHINASGNSFGIGLHLTKELVTAHHGSIQYENNPEGGSVFAVCFPLSPEVYQPDDFAISSVPVVIEEKTEAVQASMEKLTADSPLNNVKLLIIDDDDDIRQYILNVMSSYFVTRAVANGRSGLAEVKEFQPDIVLCDVLMPDMSGYDVVKQLKKDKATNHIPVILLTSLSENEDKVKAFERGADDFITKPFSVQLLLARIINIVEQRMELKEKFSKGEMNSARMLLHSNDQSKAFLDRMDLVIEHNLADPSFDMDTFASAMGYGRTQFYQKASSVTGITPNEYLRNMRLKRAAELLLDDRVSVAEVAYKTGFVDPSYFTRCFRSYYGMTPTQFQNKAPE